MADSYEIDVSLTRAEIARYNFHHIRWILVIDILGLLGVVAMTYLSIFHPSHETRELFGSLLVWAVVLLAAGLSQPFILFMQIYIIKSPAMLTQKARRVYRFDNDGIHIESEGKTARTDWGKIVTVKDIGRLIVISTGPKLAYIIPKRCLGSPARAESIIGYLLEQVQKTT
ncbi:MAG: YcxB family protein [candidate division Zixibacteria bacterium]